jgi:sorbitol-specific phosphotransferase system component IIC
MHGDDATMIGVTVMEVVEVVGAERVVKVEKAVDKSTSTRTKVLPVSPILQTDASDYGIGGYLYMIVNHEVRVIRFFSKSLVGSQ